MPRERFEELRREGFTVIVGSSLVVELAEEFGLTGLLAYSLASIRRGLEGRHRTGARGAAGRQPATSS